jgi:hypothetical protein
MSCGGGQVEDMRQRLREPVSVGVQVVVVGLPAASVAVMGRPRPAVPLLSS